MPLITFTEVVKGAKEGRAVAVRAESVEKVRPAEKGAELVMASGNVTVLESAENVLRSLNAAERGERQPKPQQHEKEPEKKP